jgi:hypothetical protein
MGRKCQDVAFSLLALLFQFTPALQRATIWQEEEGDLLCLRARAQ